MAVFLNTQVSLHTPEVRLNNVEILFEDSDFESFKAAIKADKIYSDNIKLDIKKASGKFLYRVNNENPNDQTYEITELSAWDIKYPLSEKHNIVVSAVFRIIRKLEEYGIIERKPYLLYQSGRKIYYNEVNLVNFITLLKNKVKEDMKQ